MHSLTTSYNIPSYAFHVTYGIRLYLLANAFVQRLWSDIQHRLTRTAIPAPAALCDFQMISTVSVIVFKSVNILV